MSLYTYETSQHNEHSALAISLPGKLPESRTEIRIAPEELPRSACFSVKVAKLIYTLCAGWEKRALTFTVSFFKQIRRSLFRYCRFFPTAHRSRMQTANFTGCLVSLRL